VGGAALLVVLGALTFAYSPGRAVASDDDPVVAEPLEDLRGLEVERVRIEGLPGSLADPLRQGLELAGVNTLLGHERARFYEPNLLRDLERARLFLAREGYPQAQVEAEARRTEEDRVEILLGVRPGRATRLANLELLGFPRGVAREAKDWSDWKRVHASATLPSRPPSSSANPGFVTTAMPAPGSPPRSRRSNRATSR